MLYMARDTDFVKIGVAQQSNLLRRWMELQIGNPRELEFRVLSEEGGQPEERAMHLRFKDLLVRGEWFRLEGELAAMWERSAPLNRRKAMGRPPDQRRGAEALLLRLLADGPVQAPRVAAEAKMAGFSSKTMRRAANAVGVIRPHKGLQRHLITWSLPTMQKA